MPPRSRLRVLLPAAAGAALLALFVYSLLRTGPLAPVAVTVAPVAARPLAPALAGIGTVQARYTYKIGPTSAGRVRRIDVDVGDRVKAGQLLGEMDPVDLDDRIGAGEAAVKGAEAALRQAQARQAFARLQAGRYRQLLADRAVSAESAATTTQDLEVADAALAAAREEAGRLRLELKALRSQRGNLALVAPVSGLVTARLADPGTTLVAGQSAVEMIDPASLWVAVRFDQVNAAGLAAGQEARIVLRSRSRQTLVGRVLRVEPQADVVTEETLAKVVFAGALEVLPPVGELAEVTVRLPAEPAAPTIPDAAVRVVDGRRGVWKVVGDIPVFTPLAFGRADLDGHVQVARGLSVGERVIVYSERAIGAGSRIVVADRLPGVAP